MWYGWLRLISSWLPYLVCSFRSVLVITISSGAYVQIYGCVWTSAWLAGEGQTPQDQRTSAQWLWGICWKVLAVSVSGMIIFLAEARTSPPNYSSNTTFNFPIHSCFYGSVDIAAEVAGVSCSSHFIGFLPNRETLDTSWFWIFFFFFFFFFSGDWRWWFWNLVIWKEIHFTFQNRTEKKVEQCGADRRIKGLFVQYVLVLVHKLARPNEASTNRRSMIPWRLKAGFLP